jgi:hypothetical protein
MSLPLDEANFFNNQSTIERKNEASSWRTMDKLNEIDWLMSFNDDAHFDIQCRMELDVPAKISI